MKKYVLKFFLDYCFFFVFFELLNLKSTLPPRKCNAF